MNQLAAGSHLSADLVALLSHVTSPLGQTSAVIAQQAQMATVVRWSPTMLDVDVPADAPAAGLDDGPAPVRALVYDGADLVGELLVWMRSGRLIGLEQSWYTDEPPSRWPEIEQVHVS